MVDQIILKRDQMKQRIKNSLEKLFDVKIIPEWRMDSYELANHLNKLFNHMGIKTVIDVGANEGQYANFLRNVVGFNGTILSFEPSKEMYNILQEKSDKDPNWHCFSLALGEENKKGNINIMARSQFNSLLKPKNDILFEEENSIVNTYQINISTLDDLWPTLQMEYDLSSVYLKIDTQGYDLKILKGSKNTLSKIKALQSEMSIIQIYQGMPDYKEVTRYLENNNFSYSGMFPITHDSNIRLIEFDGIFINSSYIDSNEKQ